MRVTGDGGTAGDDGRTGRVRGALRRRPSPALVLSAVALFVALGGTSYALTVTSATVKNNSLTATDIKNNSLTGSDIKENSVGSGDVRNGSLRRRDFRAGELPAGTAPTTPVTPGTQGTPGTSGTPGSALAFARVAANGTVDPATSRNIVAVSRKSAGLYCLNFTTGTPKAIVATVDISGADSRKARVSGTVDPPGVAANCPAGSDMLLAAASDASNADLPFFLAVVG